MDDNNKGNHTDGNRVPQPYSPQLDSNAHAARSRVASRHAEVNNTFHSSITGTRAAHNHTARSPRKLVGVLVALGAALVMVVAAFNLAHCTWYKQFTGALPAFHDIPSADYIASFEFGEGGSDGYYRCTIIKQEETDTFLFESEGEGVMPGWDYASVLDCSLFDGVTCEVSTLHMTLLVNAIYVDDLIDWDGFNESEEGVLDGSGFGVDIRFSDGSSIVASGYMRWSENYAAGAEELRELLVEIATEDSVSETTANDTMS